MIQNSQSILPGYQAPSAWWEHVPIAHWLIEHLKPKIVVELGTHYGVSFFSFCEAAALLSPESFIYAIDSWEGDKHAGSYDNIVYERVVAHQQACHKQRSRIIRSTFDKAAAHFKDNSIDLLHIDGLHTYEAVRHDFDTWLTKLKPDGSILFHDWNVRELDFGVWRLWEEIKEDLNFQCIEVPNGHGLGIATLCTEIPNWHRDLAAELRNLTCKGALLDQLSTYNTKNRICTAKVDELHLHTQNLEEQYKIKLDGLHLHAQNLEQQYKAEIGESHLQAQNLKQQYRTELDKSHLHAQNLTQELEKISLENNQYKHHNQALSQQNYELVIAIAQAQRGFKVRLWRRLGVLFHKLKNGWS